MSYFYSRELLRKYGVKLPAMTKGDEAFVELDRPLIDHAYLPRNCTTEQARRIGKTVSECKKLMLEKEGRTEVDLPPWRDEDGEWHKNGSYLSVNRHTVATPPYAKKNVPTIREQFAKALSKRSFIIYWDETTECPLRCIVYPAITKAEAGTLIRDAGIPSKYAATDEVFLQSFSLLTNTSKMGCWSFNLPAGPPDMLGTCRASKLAFLYSDVNDVMKAQAAKVNLHKPVEPVSFICNGCYALKSCYGNPSNIAIILARYMLANALLEVDGVKMGTRRKPRGVFVIGKEWTDEGLIADARDEHRRMKVPKGSKTVSKVPLGDIIVELAQVEDAVMPAQGGFVDLMTVAIEAANQKTNEKRAQMKDFGYSMLEFRRVEKQMMAIKEWKAMARAIKAGVPLTQVEQSELGKGRPKKLAKYYPWELPDPMFFRIHDSGDFYNDAYFKAWLEVCRRLPHIRFWAPTRMWAIKKGLLDSSVAKIPKNLALRPSTLHFRDVAPTKRYLRELGLRTFRKGRGGGYSAASGSSPKVPTERDWECPAYFHYTLGGGAITRIKPTHRYGIGGTCASAKGLRGENGCRVCWNGKEGEYNDITVFYHEH